MANATSAFATMHAHSRTQDELVWKILFDRQTALLHRRAVTPFADGLRALGLERGRLPDLRALDRQLFRLTGWHLVPVAARVPDADYLALLGQRTLPVSERLRTPGEFDFVTGPDLFHDVFGHLPLLAAVPEWVSFLEGIGRLARRRVRDEAATRALTRVYWQTAEFGLLREPTGHVRALGAGLLSSAGELHFALGPDAQRPAFVLDEVLTTSFSREHYQPAYFQLAGWEALPGLLTSLADGLATPVAVPVPVLVTVAA